MFNSTPQETCVWSLTVETFNPAEKLRDSDLGEKHLILGGLGLGRSNLAPRVLREKCPFYLRGPHFPSPSPKQLGFQAVSGLINMDV